MTVERVFAAVPRFRRNRLGFAIATIALAVCATMLALLGLSHPFGQLQFSLLSWVLAGLAAVAWLILTAMSMVARRWAKALAIPPLLTLAVLLAGQLELTLHARFAAARPAFEDAIVARGEAQPGAPCPSRVGSYRVSECSTTADSVTRFYDRDAGLDERAGFAYAPDGIPSPTDAANPISYEPLGGPWYVFTARF